MLADRGVNLVARSSPWRLGATKRVCGHGHIVFKCSSFRQCEKNPNGWVWASCAINTDVTTRELVWFGTKTGPSARGWIKQAFRTQELSVLLKYFSTSRICMALAWCVLKYYYNNQLRSVTKIELFVDTAMRLNQTKWSKYNFAANLVQ